MQRDIFISYSRKDLDLVKQIKSEISRSTGNRFWMDLDGIEAGSPSFTRNLAEAINHCKVFLFMLSDNSQSSQYALHELNYAKIKQKQLGLHVVIINIDNCQLNDEFILYCGMTDIILWTNIPQRNKLIKDLKRWVDTTDEEFKKYLEMAKAYLDKKDRANYYDFECIDEEEYPGNVVYTNQLTDEEVSQIRQLKEKYPEDYGLHLDEIFDDPDYIHDFSCGMEIVSIDTDYVWHKYKVTIHELKPDGKVLPRSYNITLRDDEYIKLLAWHLYDEHLTICTLRHRDSDLYSGIMREIDNYFREEDFFYMVDNPYVATLDEAKADADAIVKLHKIHRSGGYRWG